MDFSTFSVTSLALPAVILSASSAAFSSTNLCVSLSLSLMRFSNADLSRFTKSSSALLRSFSLRSWRPVVRFWATSCSILIWSCIVGLPMMSSTATSRAAASPFSAASSFRRRTALLKNWRRSLGLATLPTNF